jgi:serine/threonine protein kinase
MAEIFLARVCGLPNFQRMVVLKRILPVLASKADFLEMFLNEARIAATLQHPNVVQMYDVGVFDGNYFITMEYLHGEDVRSIQNACSRSQAPVPVEHAVHITLDVCAGLHYAHEKIGFDGQALNIVHRDVSPQNVIVTFDGAVKLLDFGVAKASNNLHDTQCGIVKGKLPYMSPEQCKGKPLDRRSDLFSVGIMLYELTLGRRLFAGGQSELETLKRIAEEPVPPPRTLVPNYDEQLERIVMRALAKDPERRYQTAREMQIALEDLARERGMYRSAIALQQFMSSLFGPRIEAWREEPTAMTSSIEIVIEPSTASPEPIEKIQPGLPPPKKARRPAPPWLRFALAGAAMALVVTAAPRRHSPQPLLLPAEDPEAIAAPPRLTIPQVERPALPPRRLRHVRAAPPAEAPPSPPSDSRLMLAAQPWCEVSVDDVPRGETPITLRIAPGMHTVHLTNPSFGIDSTAAVQVGRHETLRRAFRFPVATAARR